MRTRFSSFSNLPELMNIFKMTADIKTADMLDLPVPKANMHTVKTKASVFQKEMVDGLAERAKEIRNGLMNSSEDNMLNVTNDGRKLALDQRLINPLLPDDPNSKVNKCIENVFDIWQDTAEKRLTQLIFCDLSTPGGKGGLCVYDDIKDKLIKKGVPENEIAFIHNYNTDEQKQALFEKVRNGDVRVLLGSTSKMGTGMNCQTKLKALHHLDIPWRPSDVEQRNGRIIRQGNENKEVDVYRYITESTFDSYLYQTLENKQRFISQVFTSKSPARSIEDVDETVLDFAEIKAIASGNPKIKEKMELEIDIARLRTLRSAYVDNRYKMQRDLTEFQPRNLNFFRNTEKNLKADKEFLEQNKPAEFSGITINDKFYADKKEAGAALTQACMMAVQMSRNDKDKIIGSYRGFDLSVSFDAVKKEVVLKMKRESSCTVALGDSTLGNITRIDNALNGVPDRLMAMREKIAQTENRITDLKEEIKKPFPQAEELREKEKRLKDLNAEFDKMSENQPPVNKANAEKSNSEKAAEANPHSQPEKPKPQHNADAK